ncbi:hypothetical protein LXL04_004354 [Taraxacum kok-saghyz]
MVRYSGDATVMQGFSHLSGQHFPLISLKEIRIHPPASSLLADVSFYSRRSRLKQSRRRRRYHRDTTATLRHPRDAFPTADSELKPLLLRFLLASLLSDALIYYLPTLICLCCSDPLSSALIRRRHHREGHQPHDPPWLLLTISLHNLRLRGLALPHLRNL